MIRVDLATGAQTKLSSLVLYQLTNEPGTGALLAFQSVHTPVVDGISTGINLIRVSPRTGRVHSVLQGPTVDFRDGLGVASNAELVMGTMPLETGSGGTDFEKVSPVTGEARYFFNPFDNPDQPIPLYVNDLIVDAQDNVIGAMSSSTATGLDDPAEIIRFSLRRPAFSHEFDTLFRHPGWDGEGDERLTYTLDHVALAPASVAAAVPLPSAAGTGLITLVLAGCVVSLRRRAVSALRPC